MFTSDCLDINKKGNLSIGGCDTLELAEKYGTPLYVMDEQTIRKACRTYNNALKEYYNGRGKACYASKALSCKEICRIVKEEGLGLDVVSGGELYTALKADFPVKNIHFHGNNKTLQEINMAIDYKVGRIVVDNVNELYEIQRIAKQKGKKVDIAIRIKPGIEAHTHSFIKTGQIDSKFGFALETGEAFKAVKIILSCSNIDLKEVHCHIGSQILEVEPFVLAAEVMMNFMLEVKNKLDFIIQELNLGGGFGIKYTADDNEREYGDYIREITKMIKEICNRNSFPKPYIYLEPGRSIVGEAGITLYRVGAIKTIPSVRTYVSVDGSMTDNPRYILYGSKYTALVANKALQKKEIEVTVAGRCCESGDLIQENIMLQRPEKGDIIAVLSTGAYNYSMSSNYNRLPKPGIVMINEGKARIIVQRETYEDLIKKDN